MLVKISDSKAIVQRQAPCGVTISSQRIVFQSGELMVRDFKSSIAKYIAWRFRSISKSAGPAMAPATPTETFSAKRLADVLLYLRGPARFMSRKNQEY
jgi:hypothetical protein